jgi:hypothetical protein
MDVNIRICPFDTTAQDTLSKEVVQSEPDYRTGTDLIADCIMGFRANLTDLVNTEETLRLLQSIPSPKAEPLKLWLAEVGAERLEETEDPEPGRFRSLDRTAERYRLEGKPDSWISIRLRALSPASDLSKR